jgi:transposase InsO family protein
MRSRHSRRSVPTNRSANAFALGALIGVRTILSPSVGKTSSKAETYLASRSRIRNRNGTVSHRATKLRPCWVTQQARNFVARWDPLPFRFLIRDREAKYVSAFDEIFRTEGLGILRTPIKVPKANASAERFVGMLRRECLDGILILGRGHLESVLRSYLAHYDGHRPHRALDMNPPTARLLPTDHEDLPRRVSRRDILGGLIHEYERVA